MRRVLGRSLVLLALALCLGCAGKLKAPQRPGLVVSSLAVDFPQREQGVLAFTVELPRSAKEVSWTLFLDGHRFAAGLDAALTQSPGRVEVRSPLVVRHLGWREGEGTLDVLLVGEVDFGDGSQRVLFRERRDLTVQGRPQLNIPRD